MVNGEGGLDDPDSRPRCGWSGSRRTPGPAGGFRAGLEVASPTRLPVGLPVRGRHRPVRPPTPRAGRPLARVEAAVGAPSGRRRRRRLRAAVRRAGCPHRQRRPGPRPTWCRSTWPAGGPRWCPGGSSTRASCPTRTCFFGVEDFDFFCRGARGRLGGAPGRRRRPGRRRAADQRRAGTGHPQRSSQRRGRGVAGLLPRPQLHRTGPAPRATDWYAWHVAYSVRHLQAARSERSGRPSSTGCGTGSGGGSASTRGYGRDTGEYGPAVGTTGPRSSRRVRGRGSSVRNPPRSRCDGEPAERPGRSVASWSSSRRRCQESDSSEATRRVVNPSPGRVVLHQERLGGVGPTRGRDRRKRPEVATESVHSCSWVRMCHPGCRESASSSAAISRPIRQLIFSIGSGPGAGRPSGPRSGHGPRAATRGSSSGRPSAAPPSSWPARWPGGAGGPAG